MGYPLPQLREWVPRIFHVHGKDATILWDVVREYAVDSGCGVLLVEQHVQLALEIADRGCVLSHGEVVMHDKAEVLRRDRELLMASYFGERASA